MPLSFFAAKEVVSISMDDDRIRQDSPAAVPIIAEIDKLSAIAQERWDDLCKNAPSMGGLIHPSQLLDKNEAETMHKLKMRLRFKSPAEAKADLAAKRAARQLSRQKQLEG